MASSGEFLILIFFIYMHVAPSIEKDINEKLALPLDDPLIQEAVRDVGYFLRNHKFNDYDRRFKDNQKKLFAEFPYPTLKYLHSDVKSHCHKGNIQDCLLYLQEISSQQRSRRLDDPSYMKFSTNSTLAEQEMKAFNKTCNFLGKQDDDWGENSTNTFSSALERFQWRTTASYYMCWFTMLRRPALAHFGEPCDNFASCIDPTFRTNNSDPRADDSVPFACAFYSFCPDPCCTEKHLTSLQSCYKSPDNPCLEARSRNQPDVRMEAPLCKVEHTSNQDLSGLQQGHWNLSCPCPDIGYEWDSRANACVDIDECTRGGKAAIEATLPCGGPKVSACFNLPGRAACVCHWGYSWNPTVHRCKADSTLPDFFRGESS